MVLLSGVDPLHGEVLARLGVTEHLRQGGHIFTDTPHAIEYARGHLHAHPDAAAPARIT